MTTILTLFCIAAAIACVVAFIKPAWRKAALAKVQALIGHRP